MFVFVVATETDCDVENFEEEDFFGGG